MTRLALSLLGTPTVVLDGNPVTALASDKVRALLVYLAIEAHRSHRREKLAGLLWPDRPEQRARQSLSQALYDLRRAIGDREAEPPFLIVSPQTLQFNRASDHRLDVNEFLALLAACEEHGHRGLEVCGECVDRLERAATLYRGPFLDQFYLGDSAPFEEWALVQREGFQRRVMGALRRLTAHYEQCGEFGEARQSAQRQVELEPWDEAAQRGLMRALVISGQRSAALRQYRECHHALADELGLEPSRQTTELFERIRDGEYERSRVLPREPMAEAGSAVEPRSNWLRAWPIALAVVVVLSLALLTGLLKPGGNQFAVDLVESSTSLATIINETGEAVASPSAEPTLPTDYSSLDEVGIPQAEYHALLALYSEAGGVDWVEAYYWLSDSPPCRWFGVSCNEGTVVGLDLADNNLVGSIPQEIGQLGNLSVLNLSSNSLEGAIPSELGSLTYLTFLDLSSNLLSGIIPAELGGLSDLTSLSLAGNSLLEGPIPPELGNLIWLESLVLSNYEEGSQLSGPIPPELGGLVMLTEFELSGSLVGGRIPPELGNLVRLRSLNLSFNMLSGPIPPELGNLSRLTYLSTCGNARLSGPIPPELGDLPRLEILCLSSHLDGGTQLSGSIPPELGNLERLWHLDISNSLIGGPIPPELGNLSNLQFLSIVQNPFTGTVPSELGNLVNLQTLSVGEGVSYLEGPLPLSLMNLNKIDYFTYGSNTDICEPSDPAFQEWLESIPVLDGPRVVCPTEE